jgi:putative ABC transport system permease protein
MLKHYLKATVRKCTREKIVSIINILGLASCIVIVLWVQSELNWDNFHDNSDNLFKLIEKRKFASSEIGHQDRVQFPLSEKLKSDYPEIVNVTRFRRRPWQIKYNDKVFMEFGAYIDSSFLEMLSFPFVRGYSATAFENRN